MLSNYLAALAKCTVCPILSYARRSELDPSSEAYHLRADHGPCDHMMGVPVERWGIGSMEADKPGGDLFA